MSKDVKIISDKLRKSIEKSNELPIAKGTRASLSKQHDSEENNHLVTIAHDNTMTQNEKEDSYDGCSTE